MTETPSNRQPDPRSYPPYCDEEIKLIDYLRILWKWKWLIVVGTLICAASAAIISLQMPKVFEISAVIEPPVATISMDTKKITYIDTPPSVSGKIMSGGYNEKIRKALALGPSEPGIAFTSAVVAGTDLINVTSRWREEDTDRGMEATRLLLQMLSEEYKDTIDAMKSDHDRQIELKREDRELLQREWQVQETILADIWRREEALSKYMAKVERNRTKIDEQIDAIGKENTSDIGTLYALSSLMMYQTTLCSEQIYHLKVEEKLIEIKKDKLTKGIKDLDREIGAWNAKKERLLNIKIVKEPEVSPRPVAPRVRQTTLLAGAVALCFFVFLAFFIEAIKMHFPRAGKRV